MSEVSKRYGAVADGFTRRVDGIAPEGWSVTTPCSDWTVRDLVAHVTTTHRRLIATLAGTDPTDVDLDAELGPQWSAASAAIVAALGDEARAASLVGGMFGEQSFDTLVGRLLCADTLIHSWDLARATGQDETLDSEAASKALEGLIPLDDAIRRPGGFGPKIVPPPGASTQTQLLNFCGRAV